nr:hypothetical protein [Ottowia sp.]
MSDSSAFDFGKFVPGFDFLQQLAQAGTGSARAGATPLPGLGGWVAPTVSVDELDKRIQELKAVLFWLEQNSTAVKATIQALEVQKMTLAALAGMNLSMAEVAKAFTIPTPAPAPAPAASPQARADGPSPWPYTAQAEASPEPAEPEAVADEPPAAEAAPDAPETEAAGARPARAKAASGSRKRASSNASGGAAAAGLADPLQWWGALTQQFQQIASSAMREAARAVPPAGSAAVGAPADASGAASGADG